MSRYIKVSNEDGTYTEKKVYCDEDMNSFAEWCRIEGFFYEVNNKIWCNYYTEPITEKTTDQLREMWEKERREK